MLAPILSWLGSLLGGPFAKAAVEAYRAKLDAGNASERIAADEMVKRLDVQAAAEADNARLLIAEQGRWYTAAVRPMFALPFVLFNCKIVVFDRMLGLGATPELSANLLRIEAIVIAGYFGSVAIENSVRMWARKRG